MAYEHGARIHVASLAGLSMPLNRVRDSPSPDQAADRRPLHRVFRDQPSAALPAELSSTPPESPAQGAEGEPCGLSVPQARVWPPQTPECFADVRGCDPSLLAPRNALAHGAAARCS